MMEIADSTGTDVNSVSTSNDTMHSSGCSWMPLILSMKSILFFTWCGDLPTRGYSILDNSFAVAWVTDPMLDIIGLSGIPGLCPLGNP